jgi:hypothetical protein
LALAKHCCATSSLPAVIASSPCNKAIQDELSQPSVLPSHAMHVRELPSLSKVSITPAAGSWYQYAEVISAGFRLDDA